MASTARGIEYPTVSDIMTPLADRFASLADSADAAIGASVTSAIGTEADRASLTGMTEGWTFYATDTKTPYRYDGANWQVDLPGHAEFAGAGTLSDGAGTYIPVLTADPTYSRGAEFATPKAGGFAVPAGLYLVTFFVDITSSPISLIDRSYVEISDTVSNLPVRFSPTHKEDQMGGTGIVYLPTAGDITVRILQQSGASRPVDIRIKITELN